MAEQQLEIFGTEQEARRAIEDRQRYPNSPGYSNPTTSKDAAESMGEGHGQRCARLLAELQVCGSFGATCDELEQALGMLHQTTSAGLRHLVLSGKAVDSGTKRKTRSGRGAIVWHAKEGWR